MVEKLKKLYKTGFFHIFGSGVFSQIGAFVISIFVVRLLPKADYGEYVTANNIYNYFALFIGIGFTSGIMQFCTEKRPVEEKQAIYRYSLLTGTVINIVIGCLIALFSFVKYSTNPRLYTYLAFMAGLPFISYYSSFFLSVLRIQKKNTYFSYVNIASVFIHTGATLVLTHFLGVCGLILSGYITQFFTAIISCILALKDRAECERVRFDASLRKNFSKFSILCCLTNITSTILVLLDITCINLIVSNPEVTASYKVASAIPSALMFIPTCYITYIYPYLAENNNNIRKLNEYVNKSILMLFGINLLIAMTVFIFAPFIVDFLWGEKYNDAVPILRILTINFFIFGTFRKLLGNVILAIKKVSVNLINTIIAGVLNIALNIIFITKYGSIGAAVATICVSVATTVFSIIYYWIYKKNCYKKETNIHD